MVFVSGGFLKNLEADIELRVGVHSIISHLIRGILVIRGEKPSQARSRKLSKTKLYTGKNTPLSSFVPEPNRSGAVRRNWYAEEDRRDGD